MFVTIVEVNKKKYKENRKEIRKGVFIPDCFENEKQFDRWFDETLKSGKYKFYHLRANNTPVIQNFENLKLKLIFS